DSLDALDAVLKRDDGGAFVDERPDRRSRAFGVPQLHREEHSIDRPERAGVLSERWLRDPDVAVCALDDQPALAHRSEMPAAGYERHVVPALGELRAEIAADAARCHYRDAHSRVLSLIRSVAVRLCLVRPRDVDADVARLLGRERRQHRAELR